MALGREEKKTQSESENDDEEQEKRNKKEENKLRGWKKKDPVDGGRGYYSNYFSHRVKHLQVVLDHLRHGHQQQQRDSSSSIVGGEGASRGIIFLAGDSSFDNKCWFSDSASAVNGMEDILSPPVSKMDIAHHLNCEAVRRGSGLAAINCAIEESTVGDRACGRLKEHDVFLRDNVTSNDIVCISVGGNDIALKPSLPTIINILLVTCCTTNSCLESCACGTACPCDDCCCGFGPSCASNVCAWPCGFGYFIHLFRTRIQAFATNLLSGRNKPKRLLICMIYYLDEVPGGSWADFTLNKLGYDANPKKLQILIRKMFAAATEQIRVEGTEVVAVPLFAALDGKISADYSQRVEPSPQGGAKMARLIFDACTAPTTEEARKMMRDAAALNTTLGDGAAAAASYQQGTGMQR